MSDNSLSLTNISKNFGKQQAVKNLSLDIKQGELFGLIGPNGAGKTTTIKMAVGILTPTSGKISVCGVDMSQNGPKARSFLGYVPDNAPLYDRLTGLEMLELAADLNGVSKELRTLRISALLETFSLQSVKNRLILGYSRGMRQKLALCCALIHNPKILFLDEPTVGLDPTGARQLKIILRQLCDTGHTVFLSTHALDVASSLCDRVGIFHNGEMAALGTVSELEELVKTDKTLKLGLEDVFMTITSTDHDAKNKLLEALA